MDLSLILKPTLLLDENRVRMNIRKFKNLSDYNNLIFRPHFKTHRSRIIGEWFREEGVEKITVSSLRMANHFAEAGWKDITVAFPVNIREIGTINSLAKRIKLNLLVENIEAVEFLDKNLVRKIDVYIKIDAGSRRTGIDSSNTKMIKRVADAINKSKLLNLHGLLVHSGESYKATNGEPELRAIAFNTINTLQDIKAEIGQDLILSIGDTPTLSVMNEFSSIDEIRPGNFVFYDLMQVNLGSCNYTDIAVMMLCPVVAKHDDRKEVVLYGGAVHFSKDAICVDGKVIYGQLANIKTWRPYEGNYIKSLHQEHGILKCTEEQFHKIKIGDLVGVLPVHSCLTAQCMRSYITTYGEVIER